MMRARQRLQLLESHPQYRFAVQIAEVLAKLGYLTVLAGGCVRDSLLGVSPKDLDIATSAPPDVVEQSFERTLAVGKAFGTIVVVLDGNNFEVTTFRSEGPYLDGRHPSKVTFTDAKEDAFRRDFTVNALFYDIEKSAVIDYVGGVSDLERRLLKTVGVAEDRFQEDRLRMLRAVRFVGQLGFVLDVASVKAIQQQYQTLGSVSVERIFNETKRLLESAHLHDGLRALRESRLYKVFWPELESVELNRLAKFSGFLNWENVFAALCWLGNVQNPEPRLRQWKVSRESMRKIETLLKALNDFSVGRQSRAERIRWLGSDVMGELMVLLAGVFDEKVVHQWVGELLAVADTDGRLPKPWVSGEDLLKQGYAPGESMGRILRQIYDAQLEGRVANREDALLMARSK